MGVPAMDTAPGPSGLPPSGGTQAEVVPGQQLPTVTLPLSSGLRAAQPTSPYRLRSGTVNQQFQASQHVGQLEALNELKDVEIEQLKQDRAHQAQYLGRVMRAHEAQRQAAEQAAEVERAHRERYEEQVQLQCEEQFDALREQYDDVFGAQFAAMQRQLTQEREEFERRLALVSETPIMSQSSVVSSAPLVVRPTTGVSGSGAIPGRTASSVRSSVTATSADLQGLNGLGRPRANAPPEIPPSSITQKRVNFDLQPPREELIENLDRERTHLSGKMTEAGFRPGTADRSHERGLDTDDLITRNGKTDPMGNPPEVRIVPSLKPASHSQNGDLETCLRSADAEIAQITAELNEARMQLLIARGEVPGSAVDAGALRVATCGGMTTVSSVHDRIHESSSLPPQNFNPNLIDKEGDLTRGIPDHRLHGMLDTHRAAQPQAHRLR